MTTPTPWDFDDLYVISEDGMTKGDGSGWIVAKISPHNGDGAGETDRANAELIVRAVNAHEALLTAAKKADEAFRREGYSGPERDGLRAAISLAEGTK